MKDFTEGLDGASTAAGQSEMEALTETTMALASMWEDVYNQAIEEISGSWATHSEIHKM